MHDGFIRAAFWNLSETGQRLTDEELGYSFYGNRLVGVPRLRQLRVTEDTCFLVHDKLKSFVTKCFGYFTAQTESTKPFGTLPGYELNALYSSPTTAVL